MVSLRWSRGGALLLGLALAALLLQGASLAHAHLASRPGLYNHDHDLGTQATVGSGLLPEIPAAFFAAVVLLLASPRLSAPESTPAGHADSRAPPGA